MITLGRLELSIHPYPPIHLSISPYSSIQRFSVEGYPTTNEALGYLTSDQFGNTSGHWPKRIAKQKGRKLLSDLLQEGGDAAKAAVKSVRTQARK